MGSCAHKRSIRCPQREPLSGTDLPPLYLWQRNHTSISYEKQEWGMGHKRTSVLALPFSHNLKLSQKLVCIWKKANRHTPQCTLDHLCHSFTSSFNAERSPKWVEFFLPWLCTSQTRPSAETWHPEGWRVYGRHTGSCCLGTSKGAPISIA